MNTITVRITELIRRAREYALAALHIFDIAASTESFSTSREDHSSHTMISPELCTQINELLHLTWIAKGVACIGTAHPDHNNIARAFNV